MKLHAGAVLYSGRAFIFIASTGSGKTTLVSYLSESGFSYISDDGVSVDAPSLCVESAPLPLRLREESIPVLRAYGIDITEPVTETEHFRRIVYLPQSAVSGVFPIGGLFFIARADMNTCESLPADEAVRLLMENLFPDADISSCLKSAIKLAPLCRRLVYSDLNYVPELLKNE